jgi:hypothetical protein
MGAFTFNKILIERTQKRNGFHTCLYNTIERAYFTPQCHILNDKYSKHITNSIIDFRIHNLSSFISISDFRIPFACTKALLI